MALTMTQLAVWHCHDMASCYGYNHGTAGCSANSPNSLAILDASDLIEVAKALT